MSTDASTKRWVAPIGAERERWLKHIYRALKLKNGSEVIRLLIDRARSMDLSDLTHEISQASDAARLRAIEARRQQLRREQQELDAAAARLKGSIKK